MNRKRILLPALFLILSGCHTREPTTPEETGELPYGKWGFVFFTPHALPAVITYVGIIDDNKIIYSFSNLDSVDDDYYSIGHWNNRYMRFSQFNKALHPPVAILFCWDSSIDKKNYETQITFPKSVRERMSLSTGINKHGENLWYSTMLFGLAPEGKVRVWLQNSGGGDNLPVEPKKIITLSGNKLDGCKGITKHSKGYLYSQSTKDFIKGKTYPYGDW
jgi:hypothetical protein